MRDACDSKGYFDCSPYFHLTIAGKMDADLNKSYIPDLSRPSISSPKQMQVFTLRQEFGRSADSLGYKYRKGEKCGRDKKSERE